MGDVGSLALGGAIGTVAVLIRQELLLPFIGGVFIIEAVSVILQVGSYRLRNKKRIFKMAPCITTLNNWAGANPKSSFASGSAPWCLHCLHSRL